MGARGDADALLVHDRGGEDKFVADDFGIDRRDVTYNDFVGSVAAASIVRLQTLRGRELLRGTAHE